MDPLDAVEEDGTPSCKKSKTKIHFDWSEVICEILRSRTEKEISLKKLKKKVSTNEKCRKQYAVFE